MGLAYIAQILLDEGHQVSVLDINAYQWNQEEVRRRIASIDFDVVGITAIITQFSYVKWLTGVARELNPSVKIILGGALPTTVPETIFGKTDADIAVIGEGETTAKELFNSIENNGDLNRVKGIQYKENGEIHKTEPRELIKDLDIIPFPAWHLFPMENYIACLMLRHFDVSARATVVMTSRGCPYGCIYCSTRQMFGRGFRSRSVDNIMEEVKFLIKEYKINAIQFNDDIFTVDKGRVYEICDRLDAENLQIPWYAETRINQVDEKLLRRMSEAGCRVVGYGIESGSQKIMDALNKQTTVEQGKQAVKLTWKAGIIPFTFLMVGMFGETKETIQDTINFCREVNVGGPVAYLVPLPATPLWDMAVATGKMKDDPGELLDNEATELSFDFLSVNLTDMTDRELVKLRKKTVIMANMYKIYPRNIWRVYRIAGFKRFIRNSFFESWRYTSLLWRAFFRQQSKETS